jgi:hypothetical protein
MKAAVQTLERTMNEHVKSFHELGGACRRIMEPVAFLRHAPERVEEEQLPKLDNEASQESSPEVDSTASVDTEAGLYVDPRAESSVSRGDREIEEDDIQPQQTIAIIRNNGTLDIVDHYASPSQAAINNDALFLIHHGSTETLEDPPNETHSQSGIEDNIFSDSEESTVSTNTTTHFGDSHIMIYDSASLSIRRQGTIFLDRAVVVEDCRSYASEGFRFCAKTLMLDEHGSPTLILKEQCQIEQTCEHCSIHAMTDIGFDRNLPFSLQVLLEQGPPSASDGSTNSDWGHLECTIIRSTPRPELHTLFLQERSYGGQYVMPTTFTLIPRLQVFEIDANDADIDAESTRSSDTVVDELAQSGTTSGNGERHDNTSINGDADNEELERTEANNNNDEPTKHHSSLGIFSSMPCVFCGTDALRPRVDAEGVQALLLVKNQSFGYTCDRCKDRTWISGTRFGPTLIGASWSWFG